MVSPLRITILRYQRNLTNLLLKLSKSAAKIPVQNCPPSEISNLEYQGVPNCNIKVSHLKYHMFSN